MEFRLIEPADTSWNGATEILNGKKWRLSDPVDLINLTDKTKYHVISYSWGKVTGPNLFSRTGQISSRTRSALEAAIKSKAEHETQGYWIDAVCIPGTNPKRLHTLESMGFIYAQAESCIAVLENTTLNVLNHDAQSTEPLSLADMRALDHEPWTRSVWTYQELMNPDVLTFTTYDNQLTTEVHALDVLNNVGYSLSRWRKQTGKFELDSEMEFPGLNALENALADVHLNGAYLNCSALTCITAIAGRTCDPARPANRLYALFGLLSQEPSWSDGQHEDVTALTEQAIEFCEAKEDFSFMYTANHRDPSKLWRPIPDPDLGLVPIIQWCLYGQRQAGIFHSEGLVLHDMLALDIGAEPSAKAIATMQSWQHGMNGVMTETLSDLKIQLSLIFESIGLKKDAKCVACSRGLIFWDTVVTSTEKVEAYGSAEIAWSFGSPGVAKVFEHGVLQRCVPFVFVGLPLAFVEPRIKVELY